jgi:hypothetical protein
MTAAAAVAATTTTINSYNIGDQLDVGTDSSLKYHVATVIDVKQSIATPISNRN